MLDEARRARLISFINVVLLVGIVVSTTAGGFALSAAAGCFCLAASLTFVVLLMLYDDTRL